MKVEGYNPWIPISDLLAGFVLVFLLMFVSANLIPKLSKHEKRNDMFKLLKAKLSKHEKDGILAIDIEKRLVELKYMSFEQASACLDEKASAAVRDISTSIGNQLKVDGNLSLYVEGHTDPAPVVGLHNRCGYFKNNVQLSTLRAANVRQVILDTIGSSFSSRLAVAGYAESRLKNPDTPLSAENRRVEIRFVWN